jgi:RNA polymerase sigma-70 factor, ECF subfamily
MSSQDEDAFRYFYFQYKDRLFRYLLVVARGDEYQARDALQSMLLRVVRNIREFNDEAVFWSWLTVVARTAWLDQHKVRRRYFAFLDRFRGELDPVSSDLPAGDAAEDRLDEALRSALADLSPDDRQLLQWKYFGEKSVREIAALQNASEKAIESKLSRARSKLKAALLNRL